MADGSIRINCDIDINKASKSIDELMSKLNNFKSKAIELKVSADFSEINSQLENFQGLVKRAYSDGIVLTVRGTFDTINEQLENFQDLAERAYSDGITLKIRGDFSSFKSELEELKTLTENFELNQSIKIPFEVTPKTEVDDIGTGAFVKEIISLISKNNEVLSRHPLVVPIIAKGANSGGTSEFLKNSKDYKKLADNIAYFINTIPVGNKLQDVADSLVGFAEKFNTLNISGETVKSLRILPSALDGLSEIPELSGIGENLNVLFRQLSTSKSVNGEAILQVSKAIRVLSGIEKLPQDFSVLEQTGKNIHAFSTEISAINLQDDVLKAIGRIVSSVNLLSKTNKVQEDFSNLPKISSNIESYAMNLAGISMDENVMKSIQVIVSSIRSLSNIQKLPENLGSLPDIGNYINLFSNSIDSLNTTEDNVKILRIVISCIRSLASISKLPEGLETLVADGEYIVKFANSISSIEISDIASKNINLITNVLRVISSWQTKELNLEKTSKELLTFAKSLSQLNFGNTVEESQQVSKNIDILAKAMNAYSSMTSSMSKKSGELDLKPAAEQIKTFVESLTKLENPNNILGSITTIINGLNTVSSTSNKLSNIPKNTNNGTKAFDVMNKGLSRLSSGLKGALSKLTSFLGIFKRMPALARNVASSMKGVSSSIKNSATELLSKVRLIKGSITTLISIFKNLSSAYEDQISAETRFEVSIKNSSDATKKQIKEIKDLTANYQKLGILGDEVQLTGLQELSTYVENAESVKKLLPVMNDMVAQQFGFNASTENAFTVATALGKVLNGNTDTLKRYGYFFDDTQKKILKYGTEEQRVAVLTNVVSSAVGGMNNAMLNTPTGRIVQLKNYFGDLKESLGELLNFAILPLVDGIKTVIINLNLAVKSFTTFIKNSLGIKTVTHDIKSVLDVNKNKTSRSVSDTADSLGYLNDSANKAKKSVKNLLSPLDELNILSDSTSDSIADASGYLDDLSLGQGLSETIEIPNFNDFKKKLKDLLGSVSSFDKLGTTLGLKFNTFVSKLKPEKLASQLAGFVNRAVALASSFLGTADFEKLGQKVASFLNTFLFKLDTARIGKLLAQNLNAIVNFARGIITSFNFKQLGKKIASLINNFVLTFDSKNAAQLLIDAIKGALATTKELLTNTDFVALGESIGDFLNTMLTGLPIGDLADTFGDVIDSIVTTAAAAISKIDFKSTGKNIADGLNKITRRTALWKKVADTFGKAIVGVLELGISLLENTDFSALGTAIGTFIAGLPWGTILYKSGIIIWKALGGVLKATIGLMNTSPITGSLLSIGGALAIIGGATKAVTVISGLVSGLKNFALGGSLLGVGSVIGGIGIAIAGIGTSFKDASRKIAGDTFLTKYLSEDVPASVGNLRQAADDIGLNLDDIVNSAKDKGFKLNEELGKYEGYFDGLKITIDEKTGEIEGFYERIDISDVVDAYSKSIDSLVSKFSSDSPFVSSFNDSKEKVTNLRNEIALIAPTITQSGDDTDSAVDNLISALDKLKEATNTSKQSASNLLQAYVNSSKSILEEYGVEVEAVQADIQKTTDWSKKLTEKEIERFKELSKLVSEEKTLSEKDQKEYNELLDKMTGGNVAALEEAKKELNDYLEKIRKGDITFSNTEEAKEALRSITDKYKLASENLTTYSEVVSDAIDSLELPESTKNNYKKLFASLLSVDQTELDATFAKTKATIGSKIKDMWKSAVDDIGEVAANEKFGDLMQLAGVRGSDFVGHIADSLDSNYDKKMKPSIQHFYDNFSKDVGVEYDKIKKATYDFFDDVERDLKTSTNSISNSAESLGGKTSTSVADGITKKAPDIKDVVKNRVIKESIEDPLHGLNGKVRFLGIGTNILEGLEDGIKKKAPDIKDVLKKKVVNDSIKEPITNNNDGLGINSPSKFMTNVGIYTIEGLIIGLKSRKNKLIDESKKIVRLLVSSLTLNSAMLNKIKSESNTIITTFNTGLSNGEVSIKKSVSRLLNNTIDCFKTTSNSKVLLGNYSTSLITAYTSKLNLSNSTLTSISNIPKTVHNKLVSGMNSVISHLSTSSSSFMTYFTNPITRSLSSLLGSMDTFYKKFKNKWQATMNLFSVPFIGKSMGVTTVPNLNSNYYPFGNNIVKLAQGAVIKPNNEFMAILGDQKRGINIETPLETMKQAFTEALNEGNYGLGDITIPVYIGNKQLDTIILESNSRRTIRSNGRG